MGGVFLWPSSGPQSDFLFGDADWTFECHRLGSRGPCLGMHPFILRVRCWSHEAASSALLSFGASAHLVASMAQVGIQAPGLSSRCISHLGNPMKTRKGQHFVCCVHARGSCLVSPSHHMWKMWVYRFVPSRCGRKWVQVWEETSVLRDLCADLPASQRLFGRLHASQSTGQERKKQWSKRVHAPVVGLHWVTRRVNTQKLAIKTCSGTAARRRTEWKSIARSRQTTSC